MIDEKSLILIAHSDSEVLIAIYTLLDAEGYFVAPCFSEGDLLKYCAQYKPEIVMTSNPLSDGESSRLIERIKEISPKTRIVLLPDVLTEESREALLERYPNEAILRIAKALPVLDPPVPLNGF